MSRCHPASDIGRILLARYYDAADFEGVTRHAKEELAMLRALCRVVEDTPFPALSLENLTAAGAAPQQSQTASDMRRIAVVRLRRLLQASGELPAAGTLRHERQIEETIAAAPVAGRRTLERWDVSRRETLNALGRLKEIRHLTRLEEAIAETGEAGDAAILRAWLPLSVRRIVNCRCATITRAETPDRCSACGATIASHGSRPSSGPRRQSELEHLARRYLVFRRRPDPTREFG
jgi:hypothetical protein